MDEQDDDPFRGLEDWGREAERKALREHRRRHLRLVPSIPRRAGPRRGRALLWVGGAVVVAVLLAAALPAVRSWWSWWSPGVPRVSEAHGGDRPAAYPTQSLPGGVSVTTSASAAPTDPFAGTPAATYPKGEAGITLPPAAAVAGFTAAQVDTALRQVRAALVAGRLDQRMLVGHDPEPFLALLAPNARTGMRKWFAATDFGNVATWIDPGARLDPDEPPRVSGRVTFAVERVDGLPTLRITTNFVWVYAFAGHDDQPIAAEHDEIRWDFPATDRLRAGDKGMWVGDARSYGAWVDCAAAAKGLLAPGGDDPAPRPSNTEDPDAYLRTDHALDIADDCARPSPARSMPESAAP